MNSNEQGSSLTDIQLIEQARQADQEAAAQALLIRKVNNRISSLAEFERTAFAASIYEAAKSRTPSQTAAQLSQTEHAGVDTFTHSSQSCPSRKLWYRAADDNQYKSQCTSCYDPASTRASIYWEPSKHKNTLQRFPAMARKEAKDGMFVRRRVVEGDQVHCRNQEAIATPDSDTLIHSSGVMDIDWENRMTAEGGRRGAVRHIDDIELENDLSPSYDEPSNHGYPTTPSQHPQLSRPETPIVISDNSSDASQSPRLPLQIQSSPSSGSPIVITIPETPPSR